MNEREYELITKKIIGAAIEVHRVLGPGLLESAYEECLAWEMIQNGLLVKRQICIPVRYKELLVEEGYRVDMLVNDVVIIELKCVEAFQPIHTAQVLTYLKMTGLQLGLLLNFKVDLMRKGINRVAKQTVIFSAKTLRLCASAVNGSG